MPIPSYKKFSVANASRDIVQLYVTTDDHAWVKEQARLNGVKMTSVVSSLVEHAKQSDAIFAYMLELLKKQDYVLAQGGKLPEKVTAEIQALIEHYEVND